MRSIILSSAVLGLAAGASAEVLTIEPGQWTYDTTVSMTMNMNGQAMPMPAQTETTSECISSEDATLDPADITEEECEVSDVKKTADSLSFALSCSQNGMIMTGNMNMSKNAAGTETSGRFTMTGTGQGMVMNISGNLKGKRTGDC